MAFYPYAEDYDNTNSIFLKFNTKGIEVRCRLYFDTMELFVINPFKYKTDFDKSFELFLKECSFAEYIFKGDIEEIRSKSIKKTKNIPPNKISKHRQQIHNPHFTSKKASRKIENVDNYIFIKTSFNGGTSLICKEENNMLNVIGINKEPSGAKTWTRLFDRYVTYSNSKKLGRNITRYDKNKIKIIKI